MGCLFNFTLWRGALINVKNLKTLEYKYMLQQLNISIIHFAHDTEIDI